MRPAPIAGDIIEQQYTESGEILITVEDENGVTWIETYTLESVSEVKDRYK